MLALLGWRDVPPPPDAWLGRTAAGAPVVLGAATPGAGVRCTQATRGPLQAIVAGRVYNRAALLDDLRLSPDEGPFDDAAVVLRLYAERGTACLTALRGAFAIALWDARADRLLVVRDQLGLMPCFVAGERGRVAASVSAPALLALPGVSRAWDAVALDTLLTLGAVPPPTTPWLAVRQLRPGDLLVVEDGRTARRRWWQLQVPSRAGGRGDVRGPVEDRLGEVVRLRHRAGAVLLASGGFGSAVVLAAAAREKRLPARALTLTRTATGGDDARRAARLARATGTTHDVLADEVDWAAALEASLDAQGLPWAPLEAPLLVAAARGAGTRVVLAGHGAEEVLGGAGPHRAWMALRRYRRLPGPLRELAEVASRMLPLPGVRTLVAGAPLGPLACVRRVASHVGAGLRGALYTPDTLAVLGDRSGEDVLGELFADAVAAGADDPLDTLHHVALHLALPGWAALHAEVGAAGAELRLPLVDARLAHVALAVPPVRRGTVATRAGQLAPLLEGRAARTTARRPHQPLAPQPAAWRDGGLHRLLATVLAPDRVAALNVFQPGTVTRLLAEQAAGRADHAGRLWTLALVVRWLERAGAPAPGIAPTA